MTRLREMVTDSEGGHLPEKRMNLATRLSLPTFALKAAPPLVFVASLCALWPRRTPREQPRALCRGDAEPRRAPMPVAHAFGSRFGWILLPVITVFVYVAVGSIGVAPSITRGKWPCSVFFRLVARAPATEHRDRGLAPSRSRCSPPRSRPVRQPLSGSATRRPASRAKPTGLSTWRRLRRACRTASRIFPGSGRPAIRPNRKRGDRQSQQR